MQILIQSIIFLGDQKFINIINGKANHAATYPCSWCFDDKKFQGTDVQPITFGDLRQQHAAYVEAGSNKSKASKFYNVVNKPLLPFDDNLPVVLGVPPPQLHMGLRTFNYTWKRMGKHWQEHCGTEEDLAGNFAKMLNIVPESYQGNNFVGTEM